MDKRSTFRVSLIAAALASTGGFAGAQAVSTDSGSTMVINPIDSGYVASGTGDVVRSGTGECVMPGTAGASNAGVPLCGGMVIVQAPVIPEQVQVEPAPAAPPPMRRITLDADTTFNFDSAELTDEGKEQLNDIVEAGSGEEVDRLRIHITGYADRIGPEEYNLSLSEERANTVREYLVAEGLPTELITMEGRGESNPVVQCEGMAGDALVQCLQPNRRSEVEFAALERTEASAPSEQVPSSQPWAPGTDTGTPR
jgi:OOP family OmpA-OmpF porin